MGLDVGDDVPRQNFCVIQFTELIRPGGRKFLIRIREWANELLIGEENVVHHIVTDDGLLRFLQGHDDFSKAFFLLEFLFDLLSLLCINILFNFS